MNDTTLSEARLQRRAVLGHANILWRLYVGMLYFQRRRRRHGSFAPIRRTYATPRSFRGSP
jgi:hypothetical protein